MERYDDEPPAASKNLHAPVESAPEMSEFVVHFHPHGLKDPCGRMYPLGTSRIKAGHQTRELIGRLYPLHGPLSHYGLGYGTGESFFAVFAKYPFKVFRGVLVYQFKRREVLPRIHPHVEPRVPHETEPPPVHFELMGRNSEVEQYAVRLA